MKQPNIGGKVRRRLQDVLRESDRNAAQNPTYDPNIRYKLPSYGQYMDEMYSRENALRRARERRLREEQELRKSTTENQKTILDKSGGLTGGLPTFYPLKESNKPELTDQEISDELQLQMAERKSYMPDATFESTINTIKQKPNSLPEAEYNGTIPTASGVGVFMAKWVWNHIWKPVHDTFAEGRLQGKKQKATEEFYNYTPDAHKAAYDRYKKQQGITDKAESETGVKPLKSKIEDDTTKIYNQLTSPEGYISDVGRRVGDLIYDPARNPDSRFGSSGWRKDAWSKFRENLNTAQINDFQGRIIATGEVEKRGHDAISYYENLDTINGIDSALNLINMYKRGEIPAETLIEQGINPRDIVAISAQISQVKAALVEENKKLEKSKNLFQEYVPQDWLDKTLTGISKTLDKWETAMFGNNEYDWTAPIFNDADALRYNLKGFNKATTDEKKAILQKYIDARKQKIKAWQSGIEQNKKDIESTKNNHKTSDYFNYWEQRASGDLLDGDTWAYKQPGFTGSSNSSWIKQAPGYAMSAVALFSGVGAAPRVAMGSASFAGSHSASQSENFAELPQNYVKILENNIKKAKGGNDIWNQFLKEGEQWLRKHDKSADLSNKDTIKQEVLNAFMSGFFVPKSNGFRIQEASTNAYYGANATFDQLMHATDFDNWVNTMAMFSSFGPTSKLSKVVRSIDGPISPIVSGASAAGKQIFRNTKIGREIAKHYDDMTSFMTTVPNKIYKAAKKKAPNAIKTPAARKGVADVENWWSRIGGGLGANMTKSTLLKNAKELARRGANVSISEGIEEGKQYLGGQQWINGEMDDREVTFGFGNNNFITNSIDLASWGDDMLNGLKSAYVMAGFPFNAELINDPELIENIKGGMLGGLFNPGAVTTTAGAAKQAYDQIKLGKYVLNNVMKEKAARTDAFEKAKLYAQRARDPQQFANILQQFDNMQKQNKKLQGTDEYIPEEIIEQQKNFFKAVVQTANSADVINRAADLGIEQTDDKFNGLVAALSLVRNDYNDTKPIRDSLLRVLTEQLQSLEPIYELNSDGNVVRKINVGGQNMSVPYTGQPEKKEDGSIESNEELVNRLNNKRSVESIVALKVKALQDLLAQVNLANAKSNFFGESKSDLQFIERRLKKYLDRELEHVKPNLRKQFLSKVDDISSVFQNKDELLETYRKLTLADVDMDHISMMNKSLMGENARFETEEAVSEDGTKLDYLFDDSDNLRTLDNILNAYQRRVEGDIALYDALHEDYVTRYEELEDAEQAELKAEFLKEHPELAEMERIQSEQQEVEEQEEQEDKSYIALNKTKEARSRKQQSSDFNQVLKAAKKIVKNKSTAAKDIRSAFRESGLIIPTKHTKQVREFAKQLIDGVISDRDFALLFVPRDQREQYRNVEKSPKQQSPLKPVSVSAENLPTSPQVKSGKKQKVTQQPKTVAPPVQVDEEIREETPKVSENKSEQKESALLQLQGLMNKTQSNEQQKPHEIQFSKKQNNGQEEKNIINRIFNKLNQVVASVQSFAESTQSSQAIQNAIINLSEEAIEIFLSLFEDNDGYVYQSGSAKLIPVVKGIRIQISDSLGGTIFELYNINDETDDPDGRNWWNVYTRGGKYTHIASDNASGFGSIGVKSIELPGTILNKEQLLEREAVILQKLSNITKLIEKAEAEHDNQLNTDNPQQHYQDMGMTQDEYFEIVATEQEKWEAEIQTNIDNCIHALSYYITSLYNGNDLTQEDTRNAQLWIKFAETAFDKLQPGNWTNFIDIQNVEKIQQYIQMLSQFGITSTGVSLPKVRSLGQIVAEDRDKWKDFNTTHIKSLEKSVAEDDSKLRLIDVTSNDDFIEKADIELDYFPNGKGGGQVVAIFTYNGHRYTPVDVWDTSTGENNTFGLQVKTLAANKKKGDKIVPVRVGRTNGVIMNQPKGEAVSLLDAGLIEDVYSVAFNNEQDEFMLTRTTPGANGTVLVQATRPGFENKGSDVVYTYSTLTKNKPMGGNVVFMKKLNFSENDKQSQRAVPINIIGADFTDGDAQLVVDILCGKYSKGHIIGNDGLNSMFIDENGQSLGLTCRQVLNLLIPMGLFGQKGNPLCHLDFSINNSTTINFKGKLKGEKEYSTRTFYLNTEDGRNELKNLLKQSVRKNISEYVLKQSLGMPATQADSPFKGFREFLRSPLGRSLYSKLKEGKTIRFGNSSIIFDIDDLSDNKRVGGITGLGWYIKRGFLQTRFAGIRGACINFEDAKLESQNGTLETVNPKNTVVDGEKGTQENPIIEKGLPTTNKKSKLGKRISLNKVSSERSERKRTKDEIRSVLSEILPVDSIRIDTVENYLDDKDLEKIVSVTSSKPHIVGKCYSDAILLWQYAKAGVEYHEAFHRISEIFLDDNERNKIYKWYKKVWKKTHEGEPSENELIEGVADHFMYFMENREMLIFDKGIKEFFASLRRIVNFYRSIGSFGLYRMFSSVANGRFKNFEMDDAAKRRAEKFEERYPRGKSFTVGTTEFKYILDEAAYKDLKKSIIYFAFLINNIEWDGSNIQQLDLSKEVFQNVDERIEKIRALIKELHANPRKNKNKIYNLNKALDGYLEYQAYLEDEDITGSFAIKEALEHWDEILPDIVSEISSFSTDYIVSPELEDQNAEDAQDEDVTTASFSEHIKASYEFSQFSRASSRVRFFFSRITDSKFSEENGEIQPLAVVNSLGLPQFVDSKSIFNDILNQLWDVDSMTELMDRVAILSKESTVYSQIYNRLQETWDRAYNNGEYNVDEEALLVQIYNVIRSNKQNFVVTQSKQYTAGGVNGYTVDVHNLDFEYNAKKYRKDWSGLFAHGRSIFVETGEDGKLRLKKGIRPTAMADWWNMLINTDPSSRLGMAYAFSSEGERALADPSTPANKLFTMRLNIDGKSVIKAVNPKNNEQDLKICKIKFIEVLNAFGVQFDIDNLNYMLTQKYGNSGYQAMKALFQDNTKSSIRSFMKLLNSSYYGDELYVDDEGRLGGLVNPESIFSGEYAGFFGELANYKYKYRHAHDQLSVLAVQGNKFYVVSENNYISDTIHALNRVLSGKKSDAIDELKNFVYTYYKDENDELDPIGSLILKQIESKECSELSIVTNTGMKSHVFGDKGVDYLKISEKDDYVSKLAILLSGGLVFPTMSDKKTWYYIKGLILPGINWDRDLVDQDLLKVRAYDNQGQNILDEKGRMSISDLTYYNLTQNRKVLEQLRQYFITEHMAVAETLADWDSLTEDQKISNYHTAKATVKDKHGVIHHIIPGARHMSLLNLYDENDNLIHTSRTIDENGEYVSEQDEYDKLEELFFYPREDEDEADLIERQYTMIERILKHRLEEEFEYLSELGLIEKTGSGNTIFDYQNVGIDIQKVDAAYRQILKNFGVTDGIRHVNKDGNDVIEKDLSDQDVKNFKSLALATVINEGLVRSIISKNEIERVFSGHPAFFKVLYDENTGALIDRSTDEHKRYGGLISTGQNAALWAKNVPSLYRSAEINNPIVASQQAEYLKKAMIEGQFRQIYINYLLDLNKVGIEDEEDSRKIVEQVDSMTIDEIKAEIQANDEKDGTDTFKITEKLAIDKADSFFGGIDVADGAAYVTDTLFENLLRSVGNYNSDIQRAFKILRGEKVDGKVYTSEDVLEVSEAYEKVLTSVIGTQKYTAYGQRKSGRLNVPYYDKFALFPLFKIICTGKMANIYKAMVDQKVDMLKIKSATKLGNQGAKDMDFSLFREDNDPTNEDNFVSGDIGGQNWKPDFNDKQNGFKFNTYTQRMSNLRKQFNTDPHEKEFLTMGTQMTKIVLESLIPGRVYTTQDGRKLSAKKMRDDIMSSIKNIAKHGNIKLRDEFFKEDGTLDVKAFAKLLKDELSRRGAGRDVIDGFTVISDKNGDRLKVTMGAQGDVDWMQSIIASAVNKRIIDINTPGNLFIQRSVWGMQGITAVTNDKNLPKSIYNGNRLQMVNKEGSMDCVLSIDFFDKIIPKIPKRDKDGDIIYKTENGHFVYRKNEDGTDYVNENGERERIPEMQRMSFKDAKQYLIDNGIISGIKTGEKEWSDATSNIVAYRIPTQAISSIHALRCVDVLPVVRDTVILPEEFTKITGSDFDIDKLFLSFLNYKKLDDSHFEAHKKLNEVEFLDDEQRKWILQTADNYRRSGLTDRFQEGTVEYEQNKLIKDMISLLLDKDDNGMPRNVHMLHGPIDTDTSLLKNIIEDLEGNASLKERLTYQDYMLSHEVKIKMDFVTGKVGIGPFALNNNNHVLTMLYGVQFAKNKKSIMTRLNLNRLDRAFDRDSNSIMSWLSGLINIHVDNAKDPIAAKLNINPFTYNMTNLLIRTGLGKYTFYFLTQPILKQLAVVYNNAAGVYGVDKTKSVSAIRRQHKEQFIINYINQNLKQDFTEYEYRKAIKFWKDHMAENGINVNAAIDYLFNKDVSILHDVSKKYKQSGDTLRDTDHNGLSHIIEVKGRHHMISTFDLQMLVYEAFNQFEPYANALSSVVKYSKIDTKKQGKTITEQQQYEDGVFETFLKPNGTRKLFNKGLINMYENSYIRTKTELALRAYEDLMSQQLIQATPQFKQQLFGHLGKQGLLTILNKNQEQRTPELIQKCTDAMLSWIKSKYVNMYANARGINIKGLITGNNTIYDKLLKLKLDIQTKEEYYDLLDVNGNIQNYLLNALVDGAKANIDQKAITEGMGQEDTYPNAKFVKLLNFLEDDQLDSDQLRFSWHSLLNDSRFPELQSFARELIVYSFVVNSNVKGGAKNLNKFVPNSWKLLPDGDSDIMSYNEYMESVLQDYINGEASEIDYQDIILNNWHDYQFIPTERIGTKSIQRFKTYYPGGESYNADFPIILAGIITDKNGSIRPTYNDNEDSETYRPSPAYIKTERGNNYIDERSQRMFNVYKRVGWGHAKDDNDNDFLYPIYVLIGPKGHVFEEGNTVTEYSRNDSVYSELSESIVNDSLLTIMYGITKQKFVSVDEFLDQLAKISSTKLESGINIYNKYYNTNVQIDEDLMQIISDYKSWVDIVYNEDSHFVLKQTYSRRQVENDPENLYIFTDNTNRRSGNNPVDPNSWYFIKYSNIVESDEPLTYPETTTAQIRGLQNAFPISTQHYYEDNRKYDAGNWKDEDLQYFKTIVEDELLDIQTAWFTGQYKNIILPSNDGLVNGNISKITEERTPKLYKYMQSVERRIRNMVELGEPMIIDQSTFMPGEHPQKRLLDYAFNNTADSLQYIIDNSDNVSFKLIAERLLPYVTEHSVKINYTNAGKEYVAHYRPKQDDIELNLDSRDMHQYQEEILIHETLHSVTSQWLNEHKEDSDKIMELADYARQQLEYSGVELPRNLDAYFKNAKEFLTYATTDLTFRDALSKLKPMNTDKYESLLSQIIANIKEIIYKIIGNEDSTLIDQIDPIVDSILNLQSKLDNNKSVQSEDEISAKFDVHGNRYGWSVESIRKHLIDYVEQSTGLEEKIRRRHVKDVNKLYGTNFGVYKDKEGYLKLKNNTNGSDKLTLSENPNEPKQLNLFDNFDIRSSLKELGEQLMRQCGY